MKRRPDGPLGPQDFGSVWDGEGTNFNLTAPEATAVTLCLFESDLPDRPASRELALDRADNGAWQRRVDQVEPGQRYGFRVDGPFDPPAGHRFNPHKLLIDPGARALAGSLRWDRALFGSIEDGADTRRCRLDSAPCMPRSVVTDPTFEWGDDRRPRTPWSESLIYETHVRGFTRLHPEVPEALRGTYLGLIQPAVLDHLAQLGVTAIELLPVQHFISEERLVRNGLVNYFGYNPLGLCAPYSGYATGDDGRQVEEFKQMVRGLHQAGIEVILDVVFNHTAEGDHRGPTLGLRGLAERHYYLRESSANHAYIDYSGCGNSLDFGSRWTQDLILNALRVWVLEMRVDGFRFDLATTLGRSHGGEFSSSSGLVGRIRDDAVLSGVKLIAEPWDLGPGGYCAGRFPRDWKEWDDNYRDEVRRLWRGDPSYGGSRSVLLEGRGIQYITCHDGFTLHDLVSYERKHNAANLESNRDGHHDNLSRNWGIEGPTDSEQISMMRRRSALNMLSTLLLSPGTPMLSHGDEVGRTQRGNNNAYCHDSELTWMPWETSIESRNMLDAARRLVELRRRMKLHKSTVDPFEGRPGNSAEPCLTGWRIAGPSGLFLVLFNSGDHPRLISLPEPNPAGRWRILFDSADTSSRRDLGRSVRLVPLSLMVVERETARA